MTTVTMKPSPRVKATSLSCFVLIAMFLENVDDEDNSSDVTSNMMAITASHRPMSDTVRGKFILYPSTRL